MKKQIIILIVTAVIATGVSLAVFLADRRIKETEKQQIYCTMEAKICPDGTAVGRTGPKCEFSACPDEVIAENRSVNLSVKMGESKSGLGVTLTPVAVLEDSRCPLDVVCIQAGTVRLKTKILSGLGESEMVFSLNGAPITTEAEQIELIEANPPPNSKITIKPGDYVFTFRVSKRTDLPSAVNDKIKITSPLPGSIVQSPLAVKGEARGNWYFEASFPVKLLDGNGKQIAVIPAQAKGDWMTTQFVPFEATLKFLKPATDTGTLVFVKDNPSGLPENDGSVSVPVRFR